MTTTINNEHKKLNVPNLRFPEFQGEWEEHLLGNISDVTKLAGFEFTKYVTYEDTGSIIAIRGLNCKNGSLDLRDVKYIDNSDFSKLSRSKLYVGDILYTYVGTVGEVAVVDKNDKYYLAPNVSRIRLSKDYNSDFIKQLLGSKKFYNKIVFPLIATSSQPALSMENLRRFKLRVPSIKEQKKIASLFNAIDERIATQNKIIEDLKKLKSAISKKLLCNDKWTTYKIQDIAEIGRGRVISSVEIDRQKHPLYPVYSSQTSNDGIMGYLDSYMFDGEYITWTTDGANAGTVFYRKGKFNCTNVCGTLKIQPKFDCYFVSLVLQQATQKYVSSNLANPKLMNNTMASIKIRMPNIETQKQLSKVFQTLDSCLLVHQRTCKMYLSEKQYLLCQMFI